MIEENTIVNDYQFDEDNKIDLFMLAYSNIAVTIIAQYKNKQYHIIQGKNVIETLKKFINNEITLNNKFFNELTPPEKRALFTYQPNFIFITENETPEQIEELLKNLNKID
jgi:hypothetical protein